MRGFEHHTCGYRWDGSRFTWYEEIEGGEDMATKKTPKQRLKDRLEKEMGKLSTIEDKLVALRLELLSIQGEIDSL